MMIGLALICLVQSVMVLGFHNYTPWAELENSAAPHLLYGGNLLGNAGKVWMTIVSALAVVSTQNSTVNGLAGICQGMAKMNMMPRVLRKNKHGVPYFGVVFVSAFIFVFAALSDGSSDAISFLILVGSVFWMISYILAHIDVLILRKKDFQRHLAPFKVPLQSLFSNYRNLRNSIYDSEYFHRPGRAQYDLAGNRHHLPGAWNLFLLLDQIQDENARFQKCASSEGYGHGEQYVLYYSEKAGNVAVMRRMRSDK